MNRWSTRAVVAAAAVSCAAPAAAFEGRVVRADGGPVADAEVAILGRPGSVRTDADGRFRWTPDPVPPFEVLVVLAGGQYMKPVLVAELQAGPLTVQVSSALEESVMVVAGSAPSIEAAPANGVSAVPAEEIRGRQPTNVAQALENVAGTASVSEGHAAVPVVRGLAGGRTLILIDGARVTAERRAGASATYLDPASIEGIEISRGPGSVAYGSDAFGGVVQVRTRRAEPGTPLGGRLTGGYGVGTPQQRASLELTRGFARGGLLLQGHWRNFEDWRSPAGKVLNSGAEDRGVLARFDHALRGGLFSAGWQSDFGRDVERPRNNSDVVRFFYPTEDSHRLTLGWERSSVAGLRRVGTTAFLGAYEVVTDQDRLATASRPRSVERAEVAAKDFHVRAFAGKDLGRLKAEGGLDVNGRFDLEARDVGLAYDAAGALLAATEVVSTEDARRVDSGLYLQLEAAPAAAVLLSGGARVDRVTAQSRGGFFGDRGQAHQALSGFLATTFSLPAGWSATAQVARGFRDPTLSDRYFRGPTGRGFITGNPDLQPERSLQFDAAVRFTAPGWRAALFAYRYSITDLVERFQTETDFFFFRNRGEARIRGLEAEVQASLPGAISFEGAAHLVEGVALTDRAPLDSIPVPTVTLRLRRPFARGYGWVRAALFGALDAPGPTEQARPRYGVLDAGVGLRLLPRVQADLVVRNVLDEAYLASPDARATLAPGRTAIVTATVGF